MRHKWYVYKAGRLLGVSFWQLLTHDWSKFLPSEWFPYVDYFYGKKYTQAEIERAWRLTISVKTPDEIKNDFDIAWNKHQKRQPHHWQYWVLLTDNETPRLRALPIPQKYVLEMVADWAGAGKAITGKWEFEEWFLKNKDVYILEDGTRYRVQQAITKLKGKIK